MNTVREVSYEEAGAAVNAAIFAAGPAPSAESEHGEWLERVRSLAGAMGAVVGEVRLDLMRTVKTIPIEGGLDIPATQNNANRINYTINSGGRYSDTLWTDFLEGAALAAERTRLKALVGKRVRLVKVTQIDFDEKGDIKVDDKGAPSQRSFAQNGAIEIVEDDRDRWGDGTVALVEAEEPVAEAEAKRRLYAACLKAGLGEKEAKDRAKAIFENLQVGSDGVNALALQAAVQLAGNLERKVA